jgi:hypothetical protein
MIDGVPLPQELNRDIGSEINLNDLSFVDVIEGAYPAQYGLKFGAVFNMSSRAGTGPPGFDGYASYGSYNDAQSTIGYHAPLGSGGGLRHRAQRADDDARPRSPRLQLAPQQREFLRPVRSRYASRGGNNFTNITFFNNHDTFQIPNDIAYGEPGNTDDNESQADTFLAVQFHHAIGNTGAITWGPAYNQSRIQDFGDPFNDWIYGESPNKTPPPFGNGGTATDCANAFVVAPTNPTGFPTMCGLSLADQRTELDYMMQGDYTQSFGSHTLGAGISYDLSRVLKYYSFALQPYNYLSPIETPSSPNAPYTVIDDSLNLGNTYQSYIQDS